MHYVILAITLECFRIGMHSCAVRSKETLFIEFIKFFIARTKPINVSESILEIKVKVMLTFFPNVVYLRSNF